MSPPDPTPEHNPRAVHRTALVLDTHADTAQRFVDEQWDFTGSLQGGMLSLAAAREGNLDGEVFALWVDPTRWRGRYLQRALALLDGVHQQIQRHPESLCLCLSADDILAARAAYRFAILLSLEGGHVIENDLSLLGTYYRLGIRLMTLTWSNSNEWCDSSGDLDDLSIPHHAGLSRFGHEVVQEMNRLGMVVDVSHVSDQAFWDVLAASRAPIIASHSSARALTASPRNLTDDMLRALAAAGGVVMVNFFPAFIDEAWRQAWIAQRPEREAAHKARASAHPAQPTLFHQSNAIDQEFSARLGRAPFQALIDHFVHIIQVAGIDHVGLGSDFDGIPHAPAGIDSAADLPRITEALMAQGCSAEDMHKLLGGNLLRILRQVEAAAMP